MQRLPPPVHFYPTCLPGAASDIVCLLGQQPLPLLHVYLGRSNQVLLVLLISFFKELPFQMIRQKSIDRTRKKH